MTNATFLNEYPKLKMFMLYECVVFVFSSTWLGTRAEWSSASRFERQQDQHDLRDYRISADDTVRANFLNDLNAVGSRYVWANANYSIPDSAIASAAGVTHAVPTYKGTLSLGMPVQTKDPSVFSNAATPSSMGDGRWKAAVAGCVGFVTLAVGFGARIL